MDKDFDFDLELDIDPNLTPAEAFGTSVPAAKPAETPKKRRGMPKLAISIVAVCVVIGLVIGLAGKALAGGSTVKRSAKGLAANATVAFLSDLARQGTFNMELGLQELIGFDGAVTMETKYDYSSLDKARAAFDMGLTLKGNQVADVSLYEDMEQMILSSDALLPEQALGLDRRHLSENLDKSIFNPESGSDYALVEELYEMLKAYLGAGEKPETGALEKQLEAFYGSAAKMLRKSIKAHTTQTKDSDTLHFGDRDVKVRVLSYEADTEALYDIYLDVLQWAKDSKELRGLMDAVLKAYPSQAEEFANLESDPDSFYAQLDGAYNMLKDIRADFLDGRQDFKLRVHVCISKNKGELLGLKLDGGPEEDAVKLELLWGPSLAELNSISFEYDNGYSTYSVSYTVKANDKQSFSSVLKFRENSHTMFEGSFQWDKKDGGFTLKLGDDAGVAGTLEALKDGFQADVRKLTVNGNTQALNLRLTLRSGAAVDNPPAYRELTGMSEADFQRLIEDLEDAAYGLLWNRDISELLYGLMPY